MKIIYFIVSIIGVLIACGERTKLVDTEQKKENILWGQRYSYIIKSDTFWGTSSGIKADYDCFPNLDMLDTDSFTAKVEIYSRNSGLVYNSQDSNRSWICNSNENLNTHNEGIYFYVMYTKLKSDSCQIDTFSGTLTLYKID